MSNNIKIARIKKGWNQRELAKVSNVGITTVTKIEKHGIEHVKISTLNKLAKALDTTVQELFFSEEE